MAFLHRFYCNFAGCPIFQKNSFRNTIRVSISLGTDQAWRIVGSDLCTNLIQQKMHKCCLFYKPDCIIYHMSLGLVHILFWHWFSTVLKSVNTNMLIDAQIPFFLYNGFLSQSFEFLVRFPEKERQLIYHTSRLVIVQTVEIFFFLNQQIILRRNYPL